MEEIVDTLVKNATPKTSPLKLQAGNPTIGKKEQPNIQRAETRSQAARKLESTPQNTAMVNVDEDNHPIPHRYLGETRDKLHKEE